MEETQTEDTTNIEDTKVGLCCYYGCCCFLLHRYIYGYN